MKELLKHFNLFFFYLFYFTVLKNDLTEKTLGITCWAIDTIHNTTFDLSYVKNFQLYVNVALLLVAMEGS